MRGDTAGLGVCGGDVCGGCVRCVGMCRVCGVGCVGVVCGGICGCVGGSGGGDAVGVWGMCGMWGGVGDVWWGGGG